MRSIYKSSLTLAALPLLALGSISPAAAYTIPAGLGTAPGTIGSVPQPGWPNFNNGVDLTFSKLRSGFFQLTAQTNNRSPFTFNTSSAESWNVAGPNRGSKGLFSLTAVFSSSLQFLNGQVSITGKIPGYDGPGAVGTVKNRTQNLYSANLTSAGFDSSPLALGFTTDTTTDRGWASQFTTSGSPESVWFYSTNIWQSILNSVVLNSHRNSWSITLKNIQAVTTVPVPAGVWLMGSALLALTRLRRREPLAA